MPLTERIVLISMLLMASAGWAAQAPPHPQIDWFFTAARDKDAEAGRALDSIGRHWRDAYAAMVVDIARLLRPASRTTVEETDPIVDPDEEAPALGRPSGGFPTSGRPDPPSARIRTRLLRFLERQTGQRFGEDLMQWRQWMWRLPYEPHPEYAEFKGRVYQAIDPRMASFFPPGVTATIRLDEIDWGGVTVNGIPPLDHPKVTAGSEAQFLKDSNIVFGTEVNGEARAYPKRILAWHEMALDRLGGVDLTVVYCTLCGTAIPYESVVGGQKRSFGTSGLLYRSNKLMFDHETKSLWSTLEGRPVVGPLVGKGLELKAHWMVTTTWGEWRAAHANTTVLSLETGFKRDYSEGAAYRQYFATDRLMFGVPADDRRLKNKAEVLVFRLPGRDLPAEAGKDLPAKAGSYESGSYEAGSNRPLSQPVAIAADFLERNRLFQRTLAGIPVVVVTTQKGANRAYDAQSVRFLALTPDGALTDLEGRRWTVTEEALVSSAGDRLARIPAYRAFWFGWRAQYADTILVK